MARIQKTTYRVGMFKFNLETYLILNITYEIKRERYVNPLKI